MFSERPHSVSRRSFLGSSLVAPGLMAAPRQRYNILFLIADDLNTELNCYGSRNVATPNLDRLAKNGVVFQQNHCQFPLCQPSRASLLSGRRPDTTGVYTLQTPTRIRLRETVFLPELFRQNGYYTAHAGKVYHTGEHAEDPRSWDEELREFGKNPPPEAIIRKVTANGPKGHTFEWDVLNYSDPQMPDGIVAQRAVAYIEKAVREGRPFFVGAGFRRPHAPYAAPQAYFARHPWQTASLPADPPGQFPKLLKAAVNYAPPDRPLTEQQVREFRAAYFACVDFVDAQVGIVLQALDRLSLWKNTIVVFSADHGYHLGDHGGLWHKLSLFENSTRVPLIVYAPDQPGNGSVCRRLTESVDLYQTLAELCGFDLPSGLEGTSLAPLLRNPTREWKRAAFCMVGRGEELAEAPERIAFFGRSVRTARWRYTEWDGGKRGEELYDHSADPGELNNLAKKPSHAETVRTLRQLLHAGWQSALPQK
jgi:iduronate 2-sulfatase